MDVIEYIYFKKKSRGHRADNHHITLSPKGYRIPLNSALTSMLKDKGITYVSFGLNKATGQKYLIFNDDAENGLSFNLPNSDRKSVVIYSKELFVFLKNTLGMRPDENRIWISDNLSRNDRNITIEIKRD